MEKNSNLAYLGALGLLGGGGYLAYKHLKNKKEGKSIPLSKVDSSMIYELGYSPKQKIMHAKFNTGKKYRYSDVPQSEYRKLRKAESVGSHFNEHFRGRYDHEKIGHMAKEAYMGAIAGGVIGAGTGAIMADSQGNKGGVGGAIAGGLMGAAGGHMLAKGVSSVAGGAKKLMAAKPKPAAAPIPANRQLTNQQRMLPDQRPNPAIPSQHTYDPQLQSVSNKIDNMPMPNMDINLTPNFISTAIPNLKAAGGRVVQSIKDSRLIARGAKAQGNTILKNASVDSVITLISDDTFEKVAFVPVTSLAHAGVGAATGAALNSENRLGGAIAGGLVGGVIGGGVGRFGGGLAGTSSLNTQGKENLKMQLKTLTENLKGSKGMINRHNTIESFLKNPKNKELATVYRSRMVGGVLGSAGVAAAATVPQQKTAAFRAVERFHNVR